jgi:adenylyltransferase/sulfurtransferase
MPFSTDDRYSRQQRFAPLGPEGQQRLASAGAAIVGCGALGSFHAAALARAGVGKLRLIDRDYVELSNLQRQWLYEEQDAADALPKAVAAARNLARINSTIVIETEVADLSAANADDLLGSVGVVLDGTDNFETRYLINDWCVARGVPWVYGAAVASYGIAMPVLPGRTACLACLYPDPPGGTQPTCETAGVLSTITAMIAAWQVSAALQMLSGNVDSVPHKVTTIDVWSGAIRQRELPGPQPDCRVCGERRFTYLEGGRRVPISLCGRNAVQIHERSRPVDLTALGERLAGLGMVKANEFALRFFLAPYEMTVFPDGRAIIKGTQDVGVARSLYARYVGA